MGEEVAVGKERFYSLAYADNVVLMATKEEKLRRIIKRLERYLDKKSLRSKIIVLGKGREREGTKKQKWKRKKKELEVVKK